MRALWSVPALLFLSALAGYAVGARPVQAQAQFWPFSTGELVTFVYVDGRSRDCRIDEIMGQFARCAVLSDPHRPSFGKPAPPEEWVNITAVEWMTKRKQR